MSQNLEIERTYRVLSHNIGIIETFNPTLLTHLPVLWESQAEPIPSKALQEMYFLAVPMNKVALATSNDEDLLSSVIHGMRDEFTNRLNEIRMKAKNEEGNQTVELAITRSDYMFSIKDKERFYQIELNTISSSFGALSTKIGHFHKTMMPNCKRGKIAENQSLDGIIEGLGEALKLYKRQTDKKLISVLVEIENERNVFDQFPIQFGLKDKYGIEMKRFTLSKISQLATLGPNKSLIIDDEEVGLVYFRAGYSPDHYLSENEWKAREIVERSYAIKCPTISMQLAGMKKIQQEIAQEGVLEKYLSNEDSVRTRKCFAGLYPLNKETIEMVVKDCDSFVLKPQREGGGNNFFGQEIVQQLSKISEKEWNDYIIMERIFPPTFQATGIRRGIENSGEMVSEFGIYGILIADGEKILINKSIGHLLRSKFAVTNEGGIAAGYAFLDSISVEE